MRSIGFLALVVALSVPAWSSCQAAGSFQTKPAFPAARPEEMAGSSVLRTGSLGPPATEWPGCGRGRIRDPETLTCFGPADIR